MSTFISVGPCNVPLAIQCHTSAFLHISGSTGINKLSNTFCEQSNHLVDFPSLILLCAVVMDSCEYAVIWVH